ncbi:hypothetical protein BDY24DRAFT_268389 [Mrakia frigida]|uniref:uncharacterized protein n=1 Tax=Mrakia frigida TaxID=29902 RepID=UPI003FCC03C0
MALPSTGWLGGDLFKLVLPSRPTTSSPPDVASFSLLFFRRTGYFFFKKSPKQFIICGLVTVTIDSIIVAQRLYYGCPPPEGEEGEDGDEEEARGLTDRRVDDAEGREER